jgi:hypothetical protein
MSSLYREYCMRKALIFLVIVANVWFYTKELEISADWRQIFSKPTPMELFMELVGEIESNNNYNIVNSYGMLGKYQFNPTTIRYLGFDVSRDEFLNNPALQDSVMVAYIRYNHTHLTELIDRYEGTERNGVILTRAAILAGAHFAGTQGMRSYLVQNQIDGRRDGYGMTVRRYISHFQDFNLPTI